MCSWESLLLLTKKERKPQIHTHTCRHPRLNKLETLPPWKVIFYVFLHKPQAVLLPWCLRNFCLFVWCLLILLSWFVLFCFVFHCICDCHWFSSVMIRPRNVSRDPFFLFPKAPKKKKKKGWSGLCSISPTCVRTRWGQAGVLLVFLLLFFKVLCGETQITESYLPKTNKSQSHFFWMKSISFCILQRYFMFSTVLHGRLLQKSVSG